jgi:hypothetical protein
MSSPLSSSPYNSRNIEYPKYALVAFKPGTSLQASELNEIQENMLMQLTQTNRFLYDISSGDSYFSGTFLSSFNYPLITTLNEITLSSSGSSLSLNIGNSSWINIPINDQYRVWCKPESTSLTIPTTGGTVYVSYESSFVPCSSNSQDEGYIFNDNSGGVDSGCGADRVKVSATLTASASSSVELFTVVPAQDQQYTIKDKLNREITISI